MRVLIAVASKHGSTEQLGHVIARELRADQIEVEVRRAQDIRDVSGFDAVVMGSAIYGNKLMPSVLSLVQRCAAGLRAVPTFTFISGPVGPVIDPELQTPSQARLLADRIGTTKLILIGGHADDSQLDTVERAALRMGGKQPGDYRDFNQVRAWAGAIARDLHHHPSTGPDGDSTDRTKWQHRT